MVVSREQTDLDVSVPFRMKSGLCLLSLILLHQLWRESLTLSETSDFLNLEPICKFQQRNKISEKETSRDILPSYLVYYKLHKEDILKKLHNQ